MAGPPEQDSPDGGSMAVETCRCCVHDESRYKEIVAEYRL